VPDHIDPTELAEASEDLLSMDRASVVASHLESCAECSRTVAELAEVRRLLGGLSPPELPPDVADRLERVIADEQMLRTSKADALAGSSLDQDTADAGEYGAGGYGTDDSGALGRRGKPGIRRLLIALGALAVIAVLAIGGYVATGVAGLNEPPETAAAAVSPGQLRELAEAVQRGADLEPHRFSRAWLCAREVTNGTITGLAGVSLAGKPAVLVFLRLDGASSVAVVTGCDIGAPTAAASTTLPR
jgi:anti-sigma factor RsiW